MASLTRALSLAVFRVHIENGLSVAAGVGLTGLLAGWALGFDAAVVASVGAVCVSVADQPDPLSQKPWILFFALGSAFLFTALASFVPFAPYPRAAFLAATLFTGLWAGLVSAYGKRALSLAMTAVLAFVLAMGQRPATPGDAGFHLTLFSAGALFYVLYAALFAWAFDDRSRRLLLAEAMRAFADYLRAKAALYNPDSEGSATFRALIDAHAGLMDKLQAARDSLFARRHHPLQRKRIDTLIALLDFFETVLSSDADFESLRRSGRRDLQWRINRLILMFAGEIDSLTLVLRSRCASARVHGHAEEATELAEAAKALPQDEPARHAFAVTASKLKLADGHIAALAVALDRATPPSRLAAELDLAAFRQDVPRGLGVLTRQFDLSMPAMRYAIRLSLAMAAGLTLTFFFPHFAHANWVLLTIALIMRANYSVTSRRRWDRVTGTLVGCAIAVALIILFSAPMLLATIVLAVGTSHAYGGVRYRVTAVSASVSSLLLLHFSAPVAHAQFFERIADTLIGAGLSWAFSFLLPNWERSDLPRIVRGLIAADTAYAQAALSRAPVRQVYRLARKRAMDAVAQLSDAIRRLADEPHADRRTLAALNELLGANYVLASDLSSMPVLITLRAAELDGPRADAEIARTRAKVLAWLAPVGAVPNEPPPLERQVLSGLKENFAMTVLARRLAHIEYAAQRVARLARRPVIQSERP